MSRWWIGVGFMGGLGGALGCQQPQPPSTSAPDAPSVASADPLPSSSAPVTLASSRRADGCWGLDLPGTTGARVDTIAKRCAQGMSALAPLSTLSVASGGADWTTPIVKAGTCVRVIAVMAGGVEATILDAQGRALGSDRDGAFALVPSRGPACVSSDGPLKVHLTPLSGDGVVSVGVWGTTP